ncbi:hypothetical protein EDD21DRAFT_427684 [Dissophora ornata]|nr:hypothetical protein EDD21DRAFT_427684 [Dissophora ornata]
MGTCYSADNQSFITFGRDTAAASTVIPKSWVNIYNITTGSWSVSFNPPNLADNSRRDFFVVTNPTANKIYILGGDAGSTGSNTSIAFDTYDPTTRTLVEVSTPSPGPQNISTYAAVWVPRLSVMMVIGGALPVAVPQGLYLFHPDTGTWSTQATMGTFNYARTSHCAASNTDGSLIAVYGGFTTHPGSADPNVYILNTTSWTWTTTSFNGTGRGNAACAIVDDTFLIWGGFLQTPNTVHETPTDAQALLLFSLSERTWVTTYTPSPTLASRNSTSTKGSGGVVTGGSTTSGSSSSGATNSHSQTTSTSAGAIGGIAVGSIALVVLAAYGLYMVRQRRGRLGMKAAQNNGSIAGSYPDGSMRTLLPTRPPPPTASSVYNFQPSSESMLGGPKQSLDQGSNDGLSSTTVPMSLQYLSLTGNGNGSERTDNAYGLPELATTFVSHPSTTIYYTQPQPPPAVQLPMPAISDEVAYLPTSSQDSQSADPQSISSPGYYPFLGVSSSTTVASPVDNDQYHDYRMKYLSIMSSQTGYTDLSSHPPTSMYDPRLIPPSNAPPVPKRPVGVSAFGYESILSVSTQELPELQTAVRQHLYLPPPPLPAITTATAASTNGTTQN